VTPPLPPPVVIAPQPDPVQPPPVIVEPPPPLPERSIQWGRWVALAGQPATIDLSGRDGADVLRGGDYAIVRTAGREYLTPERGSASFVLKEGAATIRNDNQIDIVTTSTLKNGLLSVDFGKASFTTSFDVVSGNEVFNMMADGLVARDGRFGNSSSDRFTRPQANNMVVNGVLSTEGGGSASYLFDRRLDDQRTINGVTVWGSASK
jgi:hypothetical protein